MSTDDNRPKQPARRFRFSDDACFGLVMQNIDIATQVIKAILPNEVDEIVRVDTQRSLIGKVNGKAVRFDTFMFSNSNQVIDIEMQQSKEFNLAKRLRYYQSQIDVSFTESGQGYASICESYIIFITTYDPFGKGMPVYAFERRSEDYGVALDTKAHWLILNSTAWDNKDLSPALSDLLCYTYTNKAGAKTKLSGILDAEVRRLNEVSEADMIVTMEDKMTMNRIDYEEYMGKKIAEMQEEMNEMQSDIGGYQKQVAERDAQVAEQKKEIESLRAEIESLRKQV